MNPYLTVFVPAYNEAGNLAHCVEAVLQQMEILKISAEILIVNDCSRDQTGALAEQLAAQDQRVRAVHHAENRGIGGGFVTALQHAHGEWLILIPADLALKPSELSRYIEAAPQADVVVGLRSDLSDYNWIRKIIHYANINLLRLLFNVPVRQFQYISMYRMAVLRSMKVEYWHSAFFLAEVLIKARALGFKLVEAEIRYAPRVTGRPTGAKLKLVFTTVRDLFLFWLRWVVQGPERASRI
jgi:glycosyltransferase involved in cell wall biosynthesis